MRRANPLSQQAIYYHLKKEAAKPADRQMRRTNSRTSRSHRLEAGLVSPEVEIYGLLMGVAKVARTCLPLREKALALYNELLAKQQEMLLAVVE
jgi:hypothetical protein